LCDKARSFADVVRQHLVADLREPKELQRTIGRFEITAHIGNLHDGRLVRYRLTTRKPKDLLATWIEHLVVNCDRPTESTLITATKENQPVRERFAPPKTDAKVLLAELLEFYWRGLREPLPFFPRSSLIYAEHMLGLKKGHLSPLEQAQRKWGDCPMPWEPDKGEPPECEDDYFDLAFRHVLEPLDEEFQQIAMQVLAPALEVMEEIE
jgi:exodeoxyribonuclease V gamma subunit